MPYVNNQTTNLTLPYERFDIDLESYIGETFGKQNFAKDSPNISVVKDWSDIVEGWFYGQYETGPWWASHSKVDDDNSNGDIVFATSERWLLKILKISTIQDGVPGIFDWVGAGVGMQGEDVDFAS